MRAFVITLEGHEYSERKAARCIETGRQFGVEVERFGALNGFDGEIAMLYSGLDWTWANENTSDAVCPKTGLKQHRYGKLEPKIGCSMSHFALWQECVQINEPILILEHDAVFLRELPEIDFKGICQINDPDGATPRGKWWHDQMVSRGTHGVHPKTRVLADGRPDGLAGNSAYLVKPWAAQELIEKFYELGVWPNDAMMCRQLFPYLEEYYPFITRVEQERSTTTE